MLANRTNIAINAHRGYAHGTIREAGLDGRRKLTVTGHRDNRTPPGGTAVDRLAALVERSISDLSQEIATVQDRVAASEARTSKDTRDLLDEFRRESTHLNDRMERFHEAAQTAIAQVREELHQHERAALEGAARGAAEGASKAAGDVAVGVAQVTASAAAKAAAKGFLGTWPGKLIAASSGFTALMVALNNIPDFVRGWDSFWKYLGGMGK